MPFGRITLTSFFALFVRGFIYHFCHHLTPPVGITATGISSCLCALHGRSRGCTLTGINKLNNDGVASFCWVRDDTCNYPNIVLTGLIVITPSPEASLALTALEKYPMKEKMVFIQRLTVVIEIWKRNETEIRPSFHRLMRETRIFVPQPPWIGYSLFWYVVTA